MYSKFMSVAKLREALLQMEEDLDLSDLTQNEKDVLYAAHSAATDGNDIMTSDLIRQQVSGRSMAHATFHRALSRLLILGYVERAPNTRAKLYCISRKMG